MAEVREQSRSAQLVIRNARWVENGVSGVVAGAVISGGTLVSVGPRVDEALANRVLAAGGTEIDAGGAVMSPGFLDLHCHLREPGQAHKETILSGARAAAAGGFTRVVGMANTSPPVDCIEVLSQVLTLAAAAPIRVHSAAAVSRGLQGRELTDFGTLAALGAVAFTDDGRHSYDAAFGERALAAAAAESRVVMVHAQDEGCCSDGQVNAPLAVATGLAPWPCHAEVDVVAALVDAARLTGGRLHVQHVSCAATVDLVRVAKASGVAVTAEATPHHLALTDDRVMVSGSPDSMAKVNPPLRGEADRRAVVAGLADGTIDAIATDHAPHDAASKDVAFRAAAFGFSGLETALALCLRVVDAGELSLERMVHCLTVGPRRCLAPALDEHPVSLRPGDPADLVLFDPAWEWRVDGPSLVSMGRNSPLLGETVRGRAILTVAGGRVVHRASAPARSAA